MAPPVFNVYDITAHRALDGLESGQFTSRQIVEAYFAKIAASNDRLNAMFQKAPTALEQADARDKERHDGIIRGRLHGLPIILKASVATERGLLMETTSGNFSLSGSRPKQNACVVEQLLKSGAIILGKASLSEWSYWKIHLIPAGWSPVAGQGNNAYTGSSREPREPIFTFNGPGGSSSGPAIAVSAGYAPVAIGTETSGSLVFPADRAALYTLKPTLGIVPQGGLVPISLRFDTAGPVAKCARDVALLLDVLADSTKGQVPNGGYTSSLLGETAWKNIKVGTVDPDLWLHSDALIGYRDGQKEQIVREVMAAYERIKTKASVCSVTFKTWPDATSIRQKCGPLIGKLFEYDWPRDFERYLGTVDNCRIQSVQDLLTPDDVYSVLALPEGRAGQEALKHALSYRITDEEAYAIDAEIRLGSRSGGIDGVLQDYNVDVILGPGNGPLYTLAAAAGYPIATLPLSYLESNGCPFGLVALASANQEALLISVQSAWEESFPARKAPSI